jgi:hypothetical protein
VTAWGACHSERQRRIPVLRQETAETLLPQGGIRVTAWGACHSERQRRIPAVRNLRTHQEAGQLTGLRHLRTLVATANRIPSAVGLSCGEKPTAQMPCRGYPLRPFCVFPQAPQARNPAAKDPQKPQLQKTGVALPAEKSPGRGARRWPTASFSPPCAGVSRGLQGATPLTPALSPTGGEGVRQLTDG